MAPGVFPYAPREGQERLMDTIRSSCESRAHLVVESGTGTGKTVCALSACAEYCRGRGKKLLYVTRTNSQQKQVMLELREISGKRKVFGVALQGRRNLCPLAKRDAELSRGNPEELSKVCSERKARVLRGDENACKYYAATVSEDLQPVMRYSRDELPTAEEFAAYCVDRELCPYEVAKLNVPAAEVVTTPYIMFFDRFIRHALLDWMACSLPDIVLLVDEAHNLPSFAREMESAMLSNIGLSMAHKEIDEFGDPEVAEGISLRDFVSMLQEILESSVSEYLIDEDGLIPQSHLEEELMFRTHLTSRGVSGLVSQSCNFGEMVRDRRRLEGRLPRSYVHGTAGFLTFWTGLEEAEYVKLISQYEPGVQSFEAYCLDSSIACRPVMECHSSIHMSGTLRPLDEYRESIGLPRDSILADIPSPFPKENRLVLYVDDVTTRMEDIERDAKMIERLAGRTSELLAEVSRSAIVFYPSYAMMEKIAKKTTGATADKSVHFEMKGMEQSDFMRVVGDFKLAPGEAVLHAISGGRVSEGIDFPGAEMELAIIAGIPYPKPTAKHRAFQHFCELRFGKGWEHSVQAPTTRKLQQAIGRLIRSETDRGAAVILDKRTSHFKEALEARRTDDPVGDVQRFFERPVTEPLPKAPAMTKKGLQL